MVRRISSSYLHYKNRVSQRQPYSEIDTEVCVFSSSKGFTRDEEYCGCFLGVVKRLSSPYSRCMGLVWPREAKLKWNRSRGVLEVPFSWCRSYARDGELCGCLLRMLNGFHLHMYYPSSKWGQGRRIQGEIEVMVCLAFLSFDAEVMRETENFFIIYWWC